MFYIESESKRERETRPRNETECRIYLGTKLRQPDPALTEFGIQVFQLTCPPQ